jgi:PAS domain S-box-containing protein
MVPNGDETGNKPRRIALPLFPIAMTRFLANSGLPAESPPRWFSSTSLFLLLVGMAFFSLSSLADNRQSLLFLVVIPIVLLGVLALHAYYWLRAGREQHAVADAFYVTEREFASVFEYALDGILILDDQATCLNANPAALRILGVPSEELLGSSLAPFFTDERKFKQTWDLLVKGKNQRGSADLRRGDRKALSVDYAIAPNYLPGRHVAILCDTTARKQAETQIVRHIAALETAHHEAEALRRSTVTLTKNLSMDAVLDALLACLFEVVPYEMASVILTEGECLYVARTSAKTVQMLEGEQNTFLERVRIARKSVFVADTAQMTDWEDAGALLGVRSWICVPLLATTERLKSEHVLGLLSVGHSSPRALTSEHFHVAESFAISAAVAIQNARLYERAEIYAAELEARIGKQGEWQARKVITDA